MYLLHHHCTRSGKKRGTFGYGCAYDGLTRRITLCLKWAFGLVSLCLFGVFSSVYVIKWLKGILGSMVLYIEDNYVMENLSPKWIVHVMYKYIL